MQDKIVIRFAMTKGEGPSPAISQMNEGEKSDLRLMIQASLAFSGKCFDFPEGMPSYGHLFQAMDFALPPGSTQ